MFYQLRYHPDFSKDLEDINRNIQERIRRAIEGRLRVAPHQYGDPLRKSLKGFWKLRVGDYRIVYSIREHSVFIYGVIHRKDVYEVILKRVTSSS